jgi:hypothetical protein
MQPWTKNVELLLTYAHMNLIFGNALNSYALWNQTQTLTSIKMQCIIYLSKKPW